MNFSSPRVAIVHYWLVTNRGGEKVLQRLCNMFPQADIFTHVYDPDADLGVIKKHRITTSFINDLPFARTRYQNYLPLMPLALEQFDLTGYDLVISSEAGPAKGTIRHPDATQICYVHSPMRYIWDQYSVYREQFGFLAKLVSPVVFHYLRTWDFASAQRVDTFAANSAFVSRRIEMTYRRPSRVIYPPVAVADFNRDDPIDTNNYYLWVGALVPYKRADLAVDACTALGRKLLVVGSGPMERELKRRAGPTVMFRRRLPFHALREAYASCKALLFTGEEDFGITPVEFMAAGRPVLALGRGGALETVIHDQTGRFFTHATRQGLVEAITSFERWLPHFDPAAARARAAAFAPDRFDEGMRSLIREHGIDTEPTRHLRSIG